LELCYKSVIQQAEEVQAAHISIPSISTGIYRFPLALASKIAISTLKSTASSFVQRVSFICMDLETEGEYKNALAATSSL
jgi:O-acetyl-ADP-ribose deacetylase (regulator of RNase III)